MRILIEEYQYKVEDLRPILKNFSFMDEQEGTVTFRYVGYYYDTSLNDCVFFLPKVVMQGNRVFGKYNPEDIIDINADNSPVDETERDFIYKLAVWIYRAIVVYNNDMGNATSIIHKKEIPQSGKSKRRLANTFLDIVLSLIQFNKDNQNFFFFVLKNIHSGLNKINWTRTISTVTPIVHGSSAVYLNPVNKKRQINFDEELIVIFFSILNYINETFGFKAQFYCNVPIIKGKQFEKYIKNYGVTRLKQIKYKYFSDKALALWQLCYAFFKQSKQIYVNNALTEFLLVHDFDRVFEAIIDKLIGDNPLPDQMDKVQRDGKIIDHLFTAKSLIENNHEDTFYIGDSKYYKMETQIQDEGFYKQYTYARNVIQWNLDIINGESNKQLTSGIHLRDDLTEGYNIIPNFFISARMDEHFNYKNDGIQEADKNTTRRRSYHFKNRLFDRDTLLLFHYDVNFLFVLSLYARDKDMERAAWKSEIRNKFRDTTRKWLNESYDFFLLKAHADVDTEQYINSHFRQVIGKIYSPCGSPDFLTLALDKNMPNENHPLLKELMQSFDILPYKLGDDPAEILEKSQKPGFFFFFDMDNV